MESLFAIDVLEDFKTMSQEILNNLSSSENENSETSLNLSVTEAARREIKQTILDSSYDMDKVAAVVKVTSSDQEKVNYFLTLLEERRTDLLYELLTHGNRAHGESLSNFSWVLKLVLGSSELKSLKYPLVQLIFNTSSNGKGNQTMYELNKDSLSKMIYALENIE